MVEELKAKIEREGLSLYSVAKTLGVRWNTVKDWVEGRRKPLPVSEKIIRQFLEG